MLSIINQLAVVIFQDFPHCRAHTESEVKQPGQPMVRDKSSSKRKKKKNCKKIFYYLFSSFFLGA